MSNSEATKVEKNSGEFKKGHAKKGGRKKGTPNKRTRELFEVLGSFDPAQELIKLYNETDNKDLKVSISKELMKYVYPQRKAVEMTGDIELPEINIKGLKI